MFLKIISTLKIISLITAWHPVQMITPKFFQIYLNQQKIKKNIYTQKYSLTHPLTSLPHQNWWTGKNVFKSVVQSKNEKKNYTNNYPFDHNSKCPACQILWNLKNPYLIELSKNGEKNLKEIYPLDHHSTAPNQEKYTDNYPFDHPFLSLIYWPRRYPDDVWK